MARWVGAMLDVQRIRLGKVRVDRRDIDLVEIARACTAEFRECDVHVVACGSVLVRGDAARLSQAINAVVNALACVDSCRQVTLRIGRSYWLAQAPESTLDLELFVAR